MPIAKIDKNLCNGCGLCVDTCPEDVFRLNTQPISEELLSPCATGCPAQMSVRKYSYLVEMDMIDEAYKVLREYVPFPAITGRICPHPCESKCARMDVDGAVNINCLERFVADRFLDEKAEPVKVIYVDKVAVIGSGPAGLSCAYYLAKRGFAVTVFEKNEAVGGMLRYGIPDFRLDRNVLDAQVQYLEDMGVEFKTGVEIGKDISFDEIKEGYGAAFAAIGTQRAQTARVEGDSAEGIYGAFDFLKDVHSGNDPEIAKEVVVIGGGNVAVDTAITLKKRGAEKVTVICLETRQTMPAFEKEINDMLTEGIELHAGYGTTVIEGENGKVKGLKAAKVTSLTNTAGRFDPRYDMNDMISFDCEQIYFAIGQSVDLSAMPEELAPEGARTIAADPLTYQTSMGWVFAGGDGVKPQGGSVIAAFAAGKEAAESIFRYLTGADLKAGRKDAVRVVHSPGTGIPGAERNEPACRECGFTENEARVEAMRCMTCGSRSEIVYPEDCMVCLYCERDCPQKAITVTPDRPGKRIAPWDLA